MMNCKGFCSWLENRDLADRSESDHAMKHSAECVGCRELQAKDALLDRTIIKGMESEALPEHLEKIVDLNLDSTSPGEKKFSRGMIKVVSVLAGVCALLLMFYLVPTVNYSDRDNFGRALAQDHGVHNYNLEIEKAKDLPGWLSIQLGSHASIPPAFAGRGLKFVGGRICVIKNCRTVHLVYRDGAALVSLYIIDAEEASISLEEGRTYSIDMQGYNVRMWQENHRVYAIIS